MAADDELQIIMEALGTENALRLVEPGSELKLYRGRGCEACGNSGYKGRLGIHELLVNDDAIKRTITQRGSVEEIRRLSAAGGMTSLLQDGIAKVLEGKTDLKQVLAVCSR